MKKLALLSLATAALALGGVSSVQHANVKKEELNTEIIVRLKSGVGSKNRAAIIREQNAVISQIREYVTDSYEVTEHFTSLVNAFSIKVNSTKVTKIENLPGVQHVDFNTLHGVTYQEPELRTTRESIHVTKSRNNISASTMEKPNNTNEGEGVLIAILDTGYLLDGKLYDEVGRTVLQDHVTHNAYTELANDVTLKVTQQSIQDKIAAASKFYGKKDATHSTYFNNKVPFYYDYGGTTTVRGETAEDYDVFEQNQEHGNHVASTAAGNDPYYQGIAPKAQLALMKVFTKFTPTKEDVKKGYSESFGAYDKAILKAFIDCEVLGVDIVSMSLGSSLDDFDSDSTVQVALKTLQSKGTFVNVAAGNDGKETFAGSPYEFWSTEMRETGILSSYSNNEGAMTVAAAQADQEYYESAFLVGDKMIGFRDQVVNQEGQDPDYKTERRLTDLLEGGQDSFSWVKVPGLGEAKDYANIDVNGKIAIIDRGEITFSEKIGNATAKGAIAVGIIDNDPTNTSFNVRMALSDNPKVPVIMILYKDRDTFVTVGSGTSKVISKKESDNPEARKITSFTSDGPTYDLRIKPEISAPGQSILGGVIDAADAYEYMDGTSMATPNFSGAMAVILSKDTNSKAYRESINARIMSTANPMTEIEESLKNVHTSVRKQGAGMIDINGALVSEAYLDSSTEANKLSGKAKIELGNNDKIKAGKVALSFSGVNAGESVTYTAKTYVYRPQTISFSYKSFEDFKGVKLQATYNTLIATAENSVTLEQGQTIVNLPELDIPSSELTKINNEYEAGCYIEGFVVLESEGKETLNIPFLGFYGDYSATVPVEPFKFERQEGITYQSDLVNAIARKWGGSDKTDFASDWVSGYYDSFNDIDTTSYIKNEKALTELTGSNAKKLIQVGTDPYTSEVSPDNIYMGNNGASNTMIIAQFVTRSVANNVITLKNKATGQTVLTDHMYDALYGALEDDNEVEYQWPLYKSHIVAQSLWSNSLYAHRAYTIIPLYNNIYHKDAEEGKKYEVGELFPDGVYEMKFSYTMTDGSKFEKKYTLHIDSEAPTIASREKVTVDGNEYMRVRFNEEKLSYLTINGSKKTVKQDELGYYFDAKVADYSEKNKVFIKAFDYAGATSSSLTYLNDANEVILTNGVLVASHDFTANLTVNNGKATLSISVTKDGKEIELKGKTTVLFKLPEEVTIEDYGKLELSVESGNEILEYFVQGNSVQITTSNGFKSATVKFAEPQPEPEEPAKKKGCGGSLIASSAVLSITAALGAALLLLKKRKED